MRCHQARLIELQHKNFCNKRAKAEHFALPCTLASLREIIDRGSKGLSENTVPNFRDNP